MKNAYKSVLEVENFQQIINIAQAASGRKKKSEEESKNEDKRTRRENALQVTSLIID